MPLHLHFAYVTYARSSLFFKQNVLSWMFARAASFSYVSCIHHLIHLTRFPPLAASIVYDPLPFLGRPSNSHIKRLQVIHKTVGNPNKSQPAKVHQSL
jgi:hypothetical protein